MRQYHYLEKIKKILHEHLVKIQNEQQIVEDCLDSINRIDDLLYEDRGINARREKETHSILNQIRNEYNKIELKNTETVYDWIEFVTKSSNISEEYKKLEGTYVNFLTHYGVEDLEVCAFCVPVSSLKFVDEHINLFKYNLKQIGKDEQNQLFYRIYVLLPIVDNFIFNKFNQNAVAHELSHVEQDINNNNKAVALKGKYLKRYNTSFVKYDVPKEYENIFLSCQQALHDCCGGELTAYIQASYRQIMSVVEELHTKHSEYHLNDKGITNLYIDSEVYRRLVNLIQLKTNIEHYKTDKTFITLLEQHLKCNQLTIQQLCRNWIPKYERKIRNMMTKVREELYKLNMLPQVMAEVAMFVHDRDLNAAKI